LDLNPDDELAGELRAKLAARRLIMRGIDGNILVGAFSF
jgi:hypothetical protein